MFVSKPSFLAKNECPQARRDSFLTPRLRDDRVSSHPLCPVSNLTKYLIATSKTGSTKVFVDPVPLLDTSIYRLRLYLYQFVRLRDPGAFPKAHDLRKLAASFAFFKSMTSEEVVPQRAGAQ